MFPGSLVIAVTGLLFSDSRFQEPIVYITNRDDLMQKAFQYKVLGFVRKDKIQEELPFAISCVVQEIQKKNSHVMIFAAHRQKKEYYNLPVSDILYIESENHQTKIYTVSTKDAITVSVCLI